MTNSTTRNDTMFHALGGEAKLRKIISVFVDRIVSDIMIGFFFRGVDIERLKQLEYEHAAKFLGAKIPYSGRNLRDAHHRHRIMGGQFARRKTILHQVLVEHGVPVPIIEAWLAHIERLRPLITRDAGSDCDPNGRGVIDEKPGTG